MAEPNNGVVVGSVRLLVLDAEGRSETPFDIATGLLLAAIAGERRSADLRIYDAETDEPLATRRFSSRRAAERARTVLIGIAGPDGTDPIDWAGELARLNDRAL